MGRLSTKENKNIYQLTREALGLSREKASELHGSITQERIEKIESEKVLPYPEEVLVMSKKYKKPELCNHYCVNTCPIGQQYVPEIKMKDLPQIVLEMIASLNMINKKQERLIEITADGSITEDELGDFTQIKKELERISLSSEALRLWYESMILNSHVEESD